MCDSHLGLEEVDWVTGSIGRANYGVYFQLCVVAWFAAVFNGISE